MPSYKMSTEVEQARIIAERIARRVSGGTSNQSGSNVAQGSELSAELAAMRSGLGELQKRLAQIETKIRPTNAASDRAEPEFNSQMSERPAPLMHSPWLAGVNATTSHPSFEKFGVEEAVVSEMVDYFEKEKTCSVEPGGKPCDHCAMCSSRGF